MGLPIYLTDGTLELDVSERRAVIYGAGTACKSLFGKFSFPNIDCIVDSDPCKAGSEWVVDGKKIPVRTPDAINDLDPLNHYIVISSAKYAQEILSSIKSLTPDSSVPVFADCRSMYLITTYRNMQELIKDPMVQVGLERSSWAEGLKDFVKAFNSLFKRAHGGTDASYYFPIVCGSNNMLIGYAVGEERYVFRCLKRRGDGSVGYVYSRDTSTLYEKLNEAREEHGIGNELLVCKDESGNIIEHYANRISDRDLDDDGFISEALLMFRRFHDIDARIAMQACYLETWYLIYGRSLQRLFPKGSDELTRLNGIAHRILNSYERMQFDPCICHGDCHFNNIVRYKGKLQLIDWDSISVDDPLYDVCKFVYSICVRKWQYGSVSYAEAQQRAYECINPILQRYFNRPCTEKEYRRAELVMKGVEMISLAENCLLNGRFDSVMTDAIFALYGRA